MDSLNEWMLNTQNNFLTGRYFFLNGLWLETEKTPDEGNYINYLYASVHFKALGPATTYALFMRKALASTKDPGTIWVFSNTLSFAIISTYQIRILLFLCVTYTLITKF